MLNKRRYNSFSDYSFDSLNTINHLNMKLLFFKGILQVEKIEFVKFRILEIWTFTHVWVGNVCIIRTFPFVFLLPYSKTQLIQFEKILQRYEN